ncbi:hypothetical protein R1flu_006563 [Riccia fluitans]|uniref:30S ribosomal protein S16, chloroplastic n=1 Tax=Riccia fluitans TaxID=41844 RepID=A0ABD1YXF6_9MARC
MYPGVITGTLCWLEAIVSTFNISLVLRGGRESGENFVHRFAHSWHRRRIEFGSPALGLSRVIYTAEKKTERKQRFKEVVAAVAEVEAPAIAPSEIIPLPKKIGKGVVRLRLARLGRKKRPFYRVVATHSSWRRDGRAIELLGHYNPLHAANELGIVVKADRIKYWLGVGAQPTDTVAGILH